MLNKMYGRIKWYNSQKNYGYIISYDEQKYYFSLDNCINQNYNFKPGDVVLFIPIFEEDIAKALDVEKDRP